jgi:TPR repeat protein
VSEIITFALYPKELRVIRPIMPRQLKPTRKTRADLLVRRACSQWDAGNLRSAFFLMKSAAKLGNSIGQLDLGYFYDLGISIKRNQDLAIYWYRRAYRNNNFGGAANIGTIYRDQSKPERALAWFLKAVKMGDVDANLEIGKIYVKERWGTREAIRYLTKVAEARPQIVCETSREQALRLIRQLKRKRGISEKK